MSTSSGSLNYRRYAAIVCVLSVVLLISNPTKSLSQGSVDGFEKWSKWSNNKPAINECREGIIGFQTRGAYGHQHSFKCGKPGIRDGVKVHKALDSGRWLHAASSENLTGARLLFPSASREALCAEQEIVTNISCHGEHCAVLAIKCSPVDPDFAVWGNMIGWDSYSQSEESTRNPIVTFAGQQVLAGVRCDNPFCDDLTLIIKNIGPEPAPTVNTAPVAEALVDGEWVFACGSGQPCEHKKKTSYDFSTNFANSYGTETQRSIEAGLAVATTVSAEGDSGAVKLSASTTVTASLTTGLSEAVSKARTTEQGNSEGLSEELTCSFIVPVGKLAYFWVSTVKLGGETVTARTCLNACALGNSVPNWGPGENITSCNEQWQTCAKENESCQFSGFAQVRYGMGDKFYQRGLTGPVACSNETFGDPVPGSPKRCEILR